jgi:hypothetical protein
MLYAFECFQNSAGFLFVAFSVCLRVACFEMRVEMKFKSDTKISVDVRKISLSLSGTDAEEKSVLLCLRVGFQKRHNH